jgi:hypothetical protein
MPRKGMTTFIVRLPEQDLPRLAMFEKGAVMPVASPGVVALAPGRAVRVVRTTFRTVSRMAVMFPEWEFQALAGDGTRQPEAGA